MTAVSSMWTSTQQIRPLQVNVAGTWQTEAPPGQRAWTVVLRVDGRRIIGAVSACSGGPTEITDGEIDGNAIRFSCTTVDGDITVRFTGQINDDSISFAWEKHTREDAQPFNGTLPPPQFTVRRVPDVAGAVTEIANRARKAPAVTFDRIVHAESEPQNWLTYSGRLAGHRYSPLVQIAPSNVKDLELAWIWQAQSREPACPCPNLRPLLTTLMEATPLVVDGIMYTVQAPNDVVALDATTGRVIWTLPYTPTSGGRAPFGNGRVNRGLAVLGDTLFLGTLDAHLLAIDAYSGQLRWNATVAGGRGADCAHCFIITHAPLALNGKVIVGLGGGEYKIRGAIAAFDAATGRELWRFHTIPAAGEPGSNTWSGDSWKVGGGGVWNTGAYDPDLKLTYWGIGNPFPVYDGSSRLGDNLYTNSVVALDTDTGTLKWHYQFTPHDTADWDAAQVPVLTDMEWEGRPRKVILWANRNGLMYVLDRSTGQLLMARPFVEVNWMNGFDDKGRPIRAPAEAGIAMRPGMGGTNWFPPSFSPRTSLFYVPAWERAAGTQGTPAYGAVRAIDSRTGSRRWEFKLNDAVFTGVMSTASDLVFTGTSPDLLSDRGAARLADRYFFALDARSGQVLWKTALTGSVYSAPMSYAVNGKQYVAVAAGNTLFAFALRD
jgi:alcohol dehydrogenase (cytochrome c)